MQNLNMNHLASMTPDGVAELPPAILADLAREIQEAQDRLKKIKATYDDGLEAKYGKLAATLRAGHGKDTGAVVITDGAYSIVADLPKKVKWDQAALVAALDNMPDEAARHFAKVEVKVDERKFIAATPDAQRALMPARTVETGKQTFKIKGGDDE